MVIVPDTEAYTQQIKDQKKTTSSGEWYWDITKVMKDTDGRTRIYRSQRRIVPEQYTASGAPKRETRKGSARVEILVEEKTTV